MGKSAPKAPDPVATANAQAQANAQAVRESARVNAVDQYGPWGSTTYQRNRDGTPASQTVTLTPQGDRIHSGQMGIAEQLTGKAGQLVGQIPTGPMDISGLPGRQNSIGGAGSIQMGVGSRSGEVGNFNPSGLPSLPGVGDFGAEAQRSQDAAFQKAHALLQPGQQLDRQRMEQSLSDRGIPLDSAAGQAELTRMERSQSEAMNRAAYDAVAAGGAEQSRLFGLASGARSQMFGEGLTQAGFNNEAAGQRFGQDLAAMGAGNAAQGQQFGQNAQSAGFANQARNDALTEAIMLRNQPFNEASALLTGSPAMGMPGFQNNPAYNVGAPDIAGLINNNYQQQMGQYNQQRSGMMNGLFGLGSAALMFSDRRLKRDISRIGTGWRGLPLYLFRYVWGGPYQVGVMAQDVARAVPSAVRQAGAFLAVDYGALREAA
ncbi:tail fiber domain-containing protein [Aureimonas mangrovi]|uniref:tail fiber domain-containing protein n=1 Tax=Aureimonas mangrovi TaxID=2758041 RepID=UPI00163DB7CB|nr:tail fiber domain-containing protein [Aureimonas mangrovi]